MKDCLFCMRKMPDDAVICANCGRSQDEKPLPHHLAPGTLLLSRYLVGRAIGEGGFGITYIGKDTKLDRRVAIKEYFPHGFSMRDNGNTNHVTLTQKGTDQDFEKEMNRFLNEARVLAQLSGEYGIVNVHDFFRENGTAYIVMEYLDGITLKNLLTAKAKLPTQAVLSMMDPVLGSLARVHAADLIHRDISPDNIMVLNDSTMKLLDFGAARSISGEKSLSVMLKPGYAPAEQYRTKGVQGPWTDVYALCATIYKCITGITPDDALDRMDCDTLKPPSQLGADITPEQEAILMRGLSVRAKDRIQSADELRKLLKQASSSDVQTILIQRNPSDSAPEQRESTQKDDRTVAVNHSTPVPVNVPGSAEADERTVSAVIAPEKPAEKKAAAPRSAESHTVSGARQTPAVKNAPSEKQENVSSSSRKTAAAPKQAEDIAAVRTDTEPVGPAKKRLGLLLGAAAVVLAAVIAVVSILLGNRAPKVYTRTQPGNQSYSVQKIASISDPDYELGAHDGYFSKNAPDGGSYFYNLNGQQVTDVAYKTIGSLGNGMFRVTAPDQGKLFGLLSSQGEVLLPISAAEISWANSGTDDDMRYLYIAGETWAQVYDVSLRKPVPGLEAIPRNSKVAICGNGILVSDNSSVTLYAPDGSILLNTSGSLNSHGNGVFVVYASGASHVYNDKGEMTYSANTSVSCIRGGTYLKTLVDKKYTILDMYGQQAVPGTYPAVLAQYGNLIVVRDSKNHYGLIREDGTEYAPCKLDFASYVAAGIIQMRYSKDGYLLFNDKGCIGQYTEGYDLVYNDDSHILLLNTGKYEYSYDPAFKINPIAPGIGRCRDAKTGLYGALDTFSGSIIIPGEYEKVFGDKEGHIFCYRNGSWDVFQATLGGTT